ncbi:FIG146278: Maf/YceF/YhdE family protein [Pseudoalteromonas luteoviolacea B = ATCC 29581]|nr:FIG146278: Maf/YceF/YhdE family protein [Pseudoalteromonas luteoviolacea B = ATCC 29581]
MKTKLILASSSPFRQSILEKFAINFESFSPNVDESRLSSESPAQLVARLSELKAKAAHGMYPSGLVIGSDQVAVFKDEILGKPHTIENAVAQLSKFSGNKVTFLTGLCVYCLETGETRTIVEQFNVYFRSLTFSEIQNYIQLEQPLSCAGSFKSEGLGICLFDKLEGEDPNTLIGLPLIALNRLLREFGFNVLERQ